MSCTYLAHHELESVLIIITIIIIVRVGVDLTYDHLCCRPKKKGDSKSAPITFADVAGVDTAREELLEVVACLRDSRRYSRLNAKTPSGVLLCGPPGTGKTLLGQPSFSAWQRCRF